MPEVDRSDSTLDAFKRLQHAQQFFFDSGHFSFVGDESDFDLMRIRAVATLAWAEYWARMRNVRFGWLDLGETIIVEEADGSQREVACMTCIGRFGQFMETEELEKEDYDDADHRRVTEAIVARQLLFEWETGEDRDD